MSKAKLKHLKGKEGNQSARNLHRRKNKEADDGLEGAL